MKTLILIPSRLSAVRLPGKPLLKINGLSIISHVYKKAVDANIGEVYVAAEDQEIIDGLGDSFVTLIILCYQLNLEPKDCLQKAWNEIKNRKGKTVNGTFIREEE